MSFPRVRSEYVTEAELLLKRTQPILSSARAFLPLQERRVMSVHAGQDTSVLRERVRDGSPQEPEGEPHQNRRRESRRGQLYCWTRFDQLESFVSSFGQRSFTFSAPAQAGTWGHQALMLVFPAGDDLIVTPTPSPYHYSRPVLSPVT